MKKVKTMGVGLAGFALAALIAVNIQVGIGGSLSGIGMISNTVYPKPEPPMNCPPKADECITVYDPVPIVYFGKPITVGGSGPKKPVKN
jgi:hypothetical protein